MLSPDLFQPKDCPAVRTFSVYVCFSVAEAVFCQPERGSDISEKSFVFLVFVASYINLSRHHAVNRVDPERKNQYPQYQQTDAAAEQSEHRRQDDKYHVNDDKEPAEFVDTVPSAEKFQQFVSEITHCT